MSNSLDPDQARHIVGPDLGPNCLHSVSADDTNWNTCEGSINVNSAHDCRSIRFFFLKREHF